MSSANANDDQEDTQYLQWIVLSVVIAMTCFMSVVVVLLLRRRHKFRTKTPGNTPNVPGNDLELAQRPHVSVPTMQSTTNLSATSPGDLSYQHSTTVTAFSRGEGIEGQETVSDAAAPISPK